MLPIDLSIPLGIGTPAWPTYEPLQMKYFKRLAPNGANGQLLTHSNHVGTHLDGEAVRKALVADLRRLRVRSRVERDRDLARAGELLDLLREGVAARAEVRALGDGRVVETALHVGVHVREHAGEAVLPGGVAVRDARRVRPEAPAGDRGIRIVVEVPGRAEEGEARREERAARHLERLELHLRIECEPSKEEDGAVFAEAQARRAPERARSGPDRRRCRAAGEIVEPVLL